MTPHNPVTLEAWLRVTTEGRWPGHTEACIPVPVYPWSAPLPAPILCPPSPFTFEETRLPSSSGRLGKVTGRHILRPLAKNNGGWKGNPGDRRMRVSLCQQGLVHYSDDRWKVAWLPGRIQATQHLQWGRQELKAECAF